MIEPVATKTTVDSEMPNVIPSNEPNAHTEIESLHRPSDPLRIPSKWVLFLIVPLFIAAIAFQAFQVADMLRNREAKFDIDSSIRDLESEKSLLIKQADEWQKLATARQTALMEIESSTMELQSRFDALSQSEQEQNLRLATAKQTLASVDSDILKKQADFARIQAEMQVAQARTKAIEDATVDLSKKHQSQKAEVEQLQPQLEELRGQIAADLATIQAQEARLKIKMNETVELVRARAELAGIQEKKQTVSEIVADLEVDRERLTKRRDGLLAEVTKLQTQADEQHAIVKDLIRQRDELVAEKENTTKTESVPNAGTSTSAQGTQQ